jgi:hypothetical protein
MYACAARPLDLPEGSASDLGTTSDAAMSCGNTHRHVPVPLSLLATIDGSTQYVDDSPLRLHIAYALRAGCDLPADVTTVTQDQTGGLVVDVVAYAWLGDTGCGAPTTYDTVANVLDIPSGGGARIRVVDGGPNASVPEVLIDDTGPEHDCMSTAGVGQSCVSNCDCMDADLTCLRGSDGSSQCGTACTNDGDCASALEGRSCSGPPAYACGPTMVCHQPSDCDFDQTVTACLCTEELSPPPMPPPCRCDADCPTRFICASQGCILPCTDYGDCPSATAGPWGCGEGACTPIF